MIARAFVAASCMLAAALVLAVARRAEPTPPRTPFTEFPVEVGEWSGRRAPDLDATVVSALGVDEYVNRYYVRGDQVVHLYIGYYQTQREGSTIHSPMNCLPGSGWIPTSTERIAIGSAYANRVVIQKGLDRQLVFYWYQSHGRVVPSEYMSKIYLVLDSIRLHRTDAALVRVIAPYRDEEADPESSAEATAVAFIGPLDRLLGRFLPS